MLHLRFYTPGEGSSESIEPGPFFRLIGAMLCRGPRNEPVATYQERWELTDGEFARAEWTDPVMVYFEDNAGRASSAFGPFEDFHVAGGNAWAGSRIVARFDDRTLLWHPTGAQDGWTSLLVTPHEVSRLDLTHPPIPNRRATDRQ
jgi:hypothetical protein